MEADMWKDGITGTLLRVQKNKNWLLAKIIPIKAAPKDRESETIWNCDKSPRNYLSRVYPAASSLLLQPHLAPAATSLLLQSHFGSCYHKLALAAKYRLLQLHIGSCSHFFAHAATSLLLQSHLNPWNHLLAPVATYWLLELDLFCFCKSS